MYPDRPQFTTTLTQTDWSLHRKGPIDKARHDEKVREAIKGDLQGIVSDNSLVGSDGKTIIKVPIRSLELPRFRFDPKKNKNQVGQGEGNSKVGDVLDQAGQPGQGLGKGPEAGGTPGIDYYEAEITLDEFKAMVYADLGLPNLEPKNVPEITDTHVVFDEVRRNGPMSNLDRKRMIREALLRSAKKHGKADLKKGGIQNDDMRFRTFRNAEKDTSNAVAILQRDASGSMGEFEKYITRSLSWWIVDFLRTKYRNVQTVFLTHTTEAKEVTEDVFFHAGESGGTKVSSSYRLALDLANERYPASEWNTYPFHFTDGDNLNSIDDALCADLTRQFLARSQAMGYYEIKQSGNPSELHKALSDIKNPKFIAAVLKSKDDIYPALQHFFTPQDAAAR